MFDYNIRNRTSVRLELEFLNDWFGAIDSAFKLPYSFKEFFLSLFSQNIMMSLSAQSLPDSPGVTYKL